MSCLLHRKMGITMVLASLGGCEVSCRFQDVGPSTPRVWAAYTRVVLSRTPLPRSQAPLSDARSSKGGAERLTQPNSCQVSEPGKRFLLTSVVRAAPVQGRDGLEPKGRVWKAGPSTLPGRAQQRPPAPTPRHTGIDEGENTAPGFPHLRFSCSL